VSSAANKALIRRFSEGIWNSHDDLGVLEQLGAAADAGATP
jgi:hypothetical protein